MNIIKVLGHSRGRKNGIVLGWHIIWRQGTKIFFIFIFRADHSILYVSNVYVLIIYSAKKKLFLRLVIINVIFKLIYNHITFGN